MTTPKHGDTRNQRQVVTIDPPVTYYTREGEPVTVPSGSHREDHMEHYCDRCGWVDYGFLGGLFFPAEHDEHRVEASR